MLEIILWTMAIFAYLFVGLALEFAVLIYEYYKGQNVIQIPYTITLFWPVVGVCYCIYYFYVFLENSAKMIAQKIGKK